MEWEIFIDWKGISKHIRRELRWREGFAEKRSGSHIKGLVIKKEFDTYLGPWEYIEYLRRKIDGLRHRDEMIQLKITARHSYKAWDELRYEDVLCWEEIVLDTWLHVPEYKNEKWTYGQSRHEYDLGRVSYRHRWDGPAEKCSHSSFEFENGYYGQKATMYPPGDYWFLGGQRLGSWESILSSRTQTSITDYIGQCPEKHIGAVLELVGAGLISLDQELLENLQMGKSLLGL